MCKCKASDVLICLLILVPCFVYNEVTMNVTSTVRINELRVPSVVVHGSGGVVLDCDYSLGDAIDGESTNTNGLVVKWFLGGTAVYQWIPGSGPQAGGRMRGRLDLSYRASEDARTMHRAMHILRPSPGLSGDYTCVVSTFTHEDRQTKKMLVFKPEENLRLQRTSMDGNPTVVCAAEAVFPQPEIAILLRRNNYSKELESITSLKSDTEGLFDISAVAPLADNIVNSALDLACELRIPKVNYTVLKEFMYYPGNTSNSDAVYTWIVVTAYGVVKFIMKF